MEVVILSRHAPLIFVINSLSVFSRVPRLANFWVTGRFSHEFTQFESFISNDFLGIKSPLKLLNFRGMKSLNIKMRVFNFGTGLSWGWVNQAYSRLSTTHGISPTASWIRWCMQVYAWWFNVDLSCLGRTIYAWQFLGAKPPIQFRHRWAERNHSDHLYWLWAAQSDA